MKCPYCGYDVFYGVAVFGSKKMCPKCKKWFSKREAIESQDLLDEMITSEEMLDSIDKAVSSQQAAIDNSAEEPKYGFEQVNDEEATSLPCLRCGHRNNMFSEVCVNCDEILLPHISRSKRIILTIASTAILIAAVVMWFLPGSPLAQQGLQPWFVIVEPILLLIGIPATVINTKRLIKGDPLQQRLDRRLFKIIEMKEIQEIEFAIPALTVLRSKYPKDIRYIEQLVKGLLLLGRKDEAIRAAQELVQMKGGSFKLFVEVASFCEASQDYSGTIFWYKKAIAATSSTTDKVASFTKIAEIYSSIGDLDKAESSLKAGLREIEKRKKKPGVGAMASKLILGGDTDDFYSGYYKGTTESLYRSLSELSLEKAIRNRGLIETLIKENNLEEALTQVDKLNIYLKGNRQFTSREKRKDINEIGTWAKATKSYLKKTIKQERAM